MRIGLMTAWNDLYAALAQITHPIMDKYCQRHGYELLAGPWYHDNDGENWRMSRGDLCKSAMFLNNADQFDILMWLDVDSIIMNHAIGIEETLQLAGRAGDKSVAWQVAERERYGEVSGYELAPLRGRDWLWTCNTDGPMSGFWIGRTTPFVRAWVHRFAFACAYEYGGGDQYAMREVAKWAPYDRLTEDCLWGRLAGHCFAPEVGTRPGMEDTILYQPGDWIVTFPGLDIARRIDLMAQYAEKVTL